jgi:hypothetical protein
MFEGAVLSPLNEFELDWVEVDKGPHIVFPKYLCGLSFSLWTHFSAKDTLGKVKFF